jgi:pimeloyl-ACP methyl ester carboxylesterase
VLLQFGFEQPVLVSSGHGAVLVQLLAAWFPALVSALVLIDPNHAPPEGETISARALRECPPDWTAITARLSCRRLTLHATQPDLLAQLRAFLERGRIP